MLDETKERRSQIIPLTLGVVGVLLTPVLAAAGAVAAIRSAAFSLNDW